MIKKKKKEKGKRKKEKRREKKRCVMHNREYGCATDINNYTRINTVRIRL